MDPWVKQSIFVSPIYSLSKPEFLATVSVVAEEFIAKRKKDNVLDDAYPSYMTENINYDPRMLPFANYVAQTGWNILEEQGHKVKNLRTFFGAMWCQEHHKHSMMEQHVHGEGAQVVGFYFLNAPENCSKVLFHHPCPGKVQINLPELDINNLTDASIAMNIQPVPGLLVFSNAWVPHSFTRNKSEEPLRFIHFNINAAETAMQSSPPPAEVI
jgi:hypothetical protein